MKDLNRFLIMGCIMFICANVMSGSASEVVPDSAYSMSDYATAAAEYGKIIEREGTSSELYYNLANCYAKGGDYGHGMLYYLRALRLDPSNSDAANNVDYIDARVHDANQNELKGKRLSVDPDSTSFFRSVGQYIEARHTSDFWAIMAAVLFFIVIVSVGSYIFSRHVLVRKIGFFGGLVTLCLSVACLVFAFMAANYVSDEGVVTGTKVKLLSEASLSSKSLAVPLNRGTRLRVLETLPSGSESPEWYKVRLNSDFVGWISSADFEPIGL